MVSVTLDVAPALAPLLSGRRRAHASISRPPAPLRHVLPAAGIPLTEIGVLRIDDTPATLETVPPPGARITIEAIVKPQPVTRMAFLLDVHFGSLARRLRLLGLDVAYDPAASDPWLVARALGESRVLLTRDVGLLRRNVLAPAAGGRAHAAYIASDMLAAQVAEVLQRFVPPCEPLTRCVVCGSQFAEVPLHQVVDRLERGTWETYRRFVQCQGCQKVYWHGAHSSGLGEVLQQLR